MFKQKKKNLFLPIVLIILSVFILLGFFVYSFFVQSFNKEVQTFNAIEGNNKSLSVTINKSGSWNKDIDYDNIIDYYGSTYDVFIENTGKHIINYWSMRINLNQNVYLNQVWNGSVEIHQNISNIEKSQLLKLSSEDAISDKESLECEYLMIDTLLTFPLGEDDYLVYYPNKSKKEYPLEFGENNNSNVQLGFIFYTTTNSDIDFSDYTITYKLNYEYTSSPYFYVLLSTCFIFIIILSIYLALAIKMKKVNIRFEHDNRIIKESISVFTQFFEAKDPYTRGHSQRVAKYSAMIANMMGLSANDCREIYYIALMHDCGKCYVPDYILKKSGKLTKEEYEIIKAHTVKGAEMLKDFISINHIKEGVLYHHERYDGKGYPEGLKGENIPLVARIIAMADAFDAMNTSRCYREKLESNKIISEIKENRGKQFDPHIADIMLKLILDGEIQVN